MFSFLVRGFRLPAGLPGARGLYGRQDPFVRGILCAGDGGDSGHTERPADWNNSWWITCALVFKTRYGLIQQSLFYSPTYSADDVDCMQTNLQRAHELAPHFIY